MGSILTRRVFPFVCLVALLLAVGGCGGGAGTPDVVDATGSADTGAETLAAPEGVAPELWDQLTTELARVMAESPPRAVSTPPAGDAGTAALSYFEPTSTLTWLYQNSGDYNQDGLVGVSDLTPLGQHFGEESPGGAGEPFPAESIGAVIDGNGDGLIGISDITPIGQNFGARVEGYRVYVATDDTAHPAEPDGPNGAGTTWLSSIELSEGDASAGRLRFYHQVVPTQAEQYYWVRPCHGEEDGAASNVVQVIQPPPQAPVAALSANGNTETLAHIVWDASASHDPDGGIVRWEWDFDDDGVFEHDSDGAATVDFYYYETGDYSCTLRVTDGDGMSDETTETVHVTESATWHDTVADERVDEEGYDSIRTPVSVLDADGHPAMVYLRGVAEPDPETGGQFGIMFARAEDASGESWMTPAHLGWHGGQSADNGFFGAAAIVGDRPAIAFSRVVQIGGDSESTTYFLRARDAAGASWHQPVVVSEHIIHSPGDVEGYPLGPVLMLQVVDGRPALLGIYPTVIGGTELHYARADDENGSSWPEPVEFSFNFVGDKLATRPVGGLPAVIAHENGHDLLYYRALDVGAANWTAQASLIDEHEKAGTGMRLLQVAGNPAVVYYDSGTNDLKYRRAQQLEGEYWTEPVILDARADGNQRAVVVDGRPTVLYGDRVSGELKFIAANDAAGRLWSFPSITGLPSSVLDVVTRMGEYAEIADGPAFAYIERHAVPEDMTATSLHYVTYH